MNPHKIILWSDIHYHNYDNGLTIDDVSIVENKIKEYAESNDVGTLIFLGDRTSSRNPIYDVRIKAEESLKTLNDSKVNRIIILVGNHDRTTKKPDSSHNISYTNLYPTDLNKVTFIDYTTDLSYEDINIRLYPSDMIKDIGPIPVATYNLCLFHNLLVGSKLANNTIADKDQHSSELLDIKEYDYVFGGDNHRHQNLDFKNTTGYYVGATMQHNWGDSGEDRGFMYLDLETKEMRYIKNEWTPRFIHDEVKYESLQQLVNHFKDNSVKYKNNIIRITMSGDSDNLHGFDVVDWQNKLRDLCNARSIRLMPHVTYKQTKTIEVKSKDGWHEYVDTVKSSYPEYDINKIKDLGDKYIRDIQ